MEHWRLCEKLLRDSVIPVKTLLRVGEKEPILLISKELANLLAVRPTQARKSRNNPLFILKGTFKKRSIG